MAKITIAGAGKVGSTVAQLLAYKELGEIVLINRTPEKAMGIALDLRQSFPLEGVEVPIKGTGDYKDTKNSDIVIITAGLPRKEGMSREQLMKSNAGIVGEIAKNLSLYSPKAVMIVLTNPLDIMAYIAWKKSGFNTGRIAGMAGILDSSRFRSFISQELKVPVKDVTGMVLGGHGDYMLPLPQHSFARGKPVAKLISKKNLGKIIERTVNAGAEIIKLEGDSAFYAPASSVVQMAESVLGDKKMVLPCSVYLDGEYGIEGIFFGVPARIGKRGVEGIVELDMTKDQLNHLRSSAKDILGMIKKAGV